MDYIKLFQKGNKFHTEPTDAISTPQVFLREAMSLPTEYQQETYTPEVAPMDATSVQTAKLPETKQLPKVAQHLMKLQQQYPELTEEQLQAKYDELPGQLQANAKLAQGRTQKKTPIEEQQSQLKEKQVAVQEQAQTDAEKKAKAMQEASAMLQFISPSTWVEVMGNVDMTGAQELLADVFLDPTTYLSAGSIPLLKVATKESAEKILKEAAERGLRESARNFSKNNKDLLLSTQSISGTFDAYGYFKPKHQPKDSELVRLIDQAEKSNDTKSIEKLVQYVRGMPISKTEQDLILWRSLPIEKQGDVRALPIAGYELSTIYGGNKYLEKLKRAGFTDQEAKERVNALIENIRQALQNNPSVSLQEQGVWGRSYANIGEPPQIELSKNKAPIATHYNAAIEEMAHASHYNGNSVPENIIQAYSQIPQPYLINSNDDLYTIMQKNQVNQMIQKQNEIASHILRQDNLHNEKAVEFNKKLSPELTDEAKQIDEAYYMNEDEKRARMLRAQTAINLWHKYGISPNNYDFQYFKMYKDPQLKYFNNALLAPAIVTTTATPYLINHTTKSHNYEVE